MRRNRRVLALVMLLLGGVLAGAGVAGLRLLEPSLPPPEQSDRETLIRWLVTRDLAAESPATRQLLARHLEEEFSGDVDWQAAGQKLSQKQRRQLWENLPWLLASWLSDKADGYFGVCDQQRPAYVDRVIDTIDRWRGIEALTTERASGEIASGQPSQLMAVLSQRLEALEEQPDADGRQRMSQFLAAVQSRWFCRAFGELLPKGQRGRGPL